jgi:hypothetical protein
LQHHRQDGQHLRHRELLAHTVITQAQHKHIMSMVKLVALGRL